MSPAGRCSTAPGWTWKWWSASPRCTGPRRSGSATTRWGCTPRASYLADFGTPAGIAELGKHRLVYFVDSMLQVDDLDAPRRLVPGMQDSLSSTNVFVHVEATRAGAGIGFLPCFMAGRHPDLVRLLPEDFAERLPYWMVLRPDSLRQPAVAAVAEALRRRTPPWKARCWAPNPLDF